MTVAQITQVFNSSQIHKSIFLKSPTSFTVFLKELSLFYHSLKLMDSKHALKLFNLFTFYKLIRLICLLSIFLDWFILCVCLFHLYKGKSKAVNRSHMRRTNLARALAFRFRVNPTTISTSACWLFLKSWRLKMADVDGVLISTTEKHQDFRVNVKSKRIVTYQLIKYKSLLIKLLERQQELNESDVEKMLQEMLLVSTKLF